MECIAGYCLHFSFKGLCKVINNSKKVAVDVGGLNQILGGNRPRMFLLVAPTNMLGYLVYQCILCVYMCTYIFIKIISIYDLSVLSMSVMA